MITNVNQRPCPSARSGRCAQSKIDTPRLSLRVPGAPRSMWSPATLTSSSVQPAGRAPSNARTASRAERISPTRRERHHVYYRRRSPSQTSSQSQLRYESEREHDRELGLHESLRIVLLGTAADVEGVILALKCRSEPAAETRARSRDHRDADLHPKSALSRGRIRRTNAYGCSSATKAPSAWLPSVTASGVGPRLTKVEKYPVTNR